MNFLLNRKLNCDLFESPVLIIFVPSYTRKEVFKIKHTTTLLSDAGRWKTLGVPVVIGWDNLPSPIEIGLTDLPNIGGGAVAPRFRHHCYFTTYEMDKNVIYCNMNQNFVLEPFEFHWFIHFLNRTLCKWDLGFFVLLLWLIEFVRFFDTHKMDWIVQKWPTIPIYLSKFYIINCCQAFLVVTSSFKSHCLYAYTNLECWSAFEYIEFGHLYWNCWPFLDNSVCFV